MELLRICGFCLTALVLIEMCIRDSTSTQARSKSAWTSSLSCRRMEAEGMLWDTI